MELNKYLVIQWAGQEQAIAFPASIKHSDLFQYIRREHPQVRTVSAGFFLDETDAFWHGGQSLSLNLRSRPQDGELIKTMLRSTDRRLWDLAVLAWEACESVRRHDPAPGSMELSMS